MASNPTHSDPASRDAATAEDHIATPPPPPHLLGPLNDDQGNAAQHGLEHDLPSPHAAAEGGADELFLEDDNFEWRGVAVENEENGVGGSEDESDGDPNDNVQNDYVYEELEEWDAESTGTHSSDTLSRENESDGEEDPPAEFDQELPARHMYLGEAMEELTGRVVLEEGAVLEIPIVVMNFHLIPGQTLPMTVFHAVFQNAIRRCVVNERVFGVVHSGVESMDGRTVVSRNALGTLAEIYEFQEESDLPLDMAQMGTNFALKAKGRQRFNVLEVRRQGDGNLMAKVRIRPEVHLPPLMQQVMSHATMRFQFPALTPSASSPPQPTTPPHAHRPPPHDQDAFHQHKVEEVAHNAAMEKLGLEILGRRRVTKYYSRLTPWPHFVYEHYDERMLVERVHQKLRTELRGLAESHRKVPLEASELSFWLAQNLTMDDAIRLQLLSMDSPIQRLRFELNLLENVVSLECGVISCRECLQIVAGQGDIFAMSTEGPQGTYVNPNGYIHETLTVHRARDVVTRGFPSTEASWFQGYSWTIVECRGCGQHLGWKFRAVARLKPSKFWGLARKSVTFKYDFSAADAKHSHGTAERTGPVLAPSELHSTPNAPQGRPPMAAAQAPMEASPPLLLQSRGEERE